MAKILRAAKAALAIRTEEGHKWWRWVLYHHL